MILGEISCRSEGFQNLQEGILYKITKSEICKKNIGRPQVCFLQKSDILEFARSSSCKTPPGAPELLPLLRVSRPGHPPGAAQHTYIKG